MPRQLQSFAVIVAVVTASFYSCSPKNREDESYRSDHAGVRKDTGEAGIMMNSKPDR